MASVADKLKKPEGKYGVGPGPEGTPLSPEEMDKRKKKKKDVDDAEENFDVEILVPMG